MLVSIAERKPRAPSAPDTKQAKHRAKVRSAWISFAGRIVAQILGAAATVGFALVVLGSESTPPDAASAVTVPSPSHAGHPQLARPTVAVLPFQTYAVTADHNHMAGAITDLLVTELAQQKEIGVTSLTSTMRYRGASATVPEIGQQLGASHIVEGSVAVASGRARVIAQLIDAASDKHLWARSYETTVDDALELERRIAGEIARDVTRALEEGVR